MLTEWFISAVPDFRSEDGIPLEFSETMTEDFHLDTIEALESSITHAPTHATALREARAWRERTAPGQDGIGRATRLDLIGAQHLLGLVGCCPLEVLETILAPLLKDFLVQMKSKKVDGTRIMVLLAVDEVMQRLLTSEQG
ncbi:unnamed protein product, partial [Choristocarpus tenellus]